MPNQVVEAVMAQLASLLTSALLDFNRKSSDHIGSKPPLFVGVLFNQGIPTVRWYTPPLFAPFACTPFMYGLTHPYTCILYLHKG